MRNPHTMNVCAIQRISDGYWWECNGEHGAGWNPKRIRQAWTLREADIEVRKMIERGTPAEDLRIVELGPREPSDGGAGS